MKTLSRVLATVGFLGYVPFAPGTAASLFAALAFLLFPTYLSVPIFTIFLIILLAVAVWSASSLSDEQHSDPSEVVIDEVAGMVVTLAFLPLTSPTIWGGFLLFRALDIIKPFPARQAERLPRGWGIVADDVIAGIYANLVLRIVIEVWPVVGS